MRVYHLVFFALAACFPWQLAAGVEDNATVIGNSRNCAAMTDVNCGGANCTTCQAGQRCKVDEDCASSSCNLDGICENGFIGGRSNFSYPNYDLNEDESHPLLVYSFIAVALAAILLAFVYYKSRKGRLADGAFHDLERTPPPPPPRTSTSTSIQLT